MEDEDILESLELLFRERVLPPVLSNKIINKSPLRYPGGKTRACKKLDTILNEHFNMDSIKTIISPFFGGGSFEFYLQNKYNLNIVANDKFKPLFSFWDVCKRYKQYLCDELNNIDDVTKVQFTEYRDNIMEETDTFAQAKHYFIINRCSFSGATLSGGFSEEASKKRFTKSSIDRINKLILSNFEIYNSDFVDFIDKYESIPSSILFLDPPYYLEKASKLYGNNGDMHDTFDHKKLYKIISQKEHWIMTYNNCDYIKDLYRNFMIVETDWTYGMNKSKKSSEIVIICV